MTRALPLRSSPTITALRALTVCRPVLTSLEETAAPAGYNQLIKDITIVLKEDGSATIDDAASTPEADRSLTAGVANSTGTMLPETGGIGTVIFVALGALAVICAGVFLVTNKRMSKESF